MKLRSLFPIGLSFFFFFFISRTNAQILKPVQWTYSYEKLSSKEGYIVMTASIGKGWHIYAQDLGAGEGPIPTSFKFEKNASYSLVGKTNPNIKPRVSFDKSFNKNIGILENKVVFKQKVKVQPNLKEIKGSLEFMVCNDRQCLPPSDLDFEVKVY